MSTRQWGSLKAGASSRPPTPFLKWAGGKTQVLDALRPFFPELATEATYYEPFVGGGAAFFSIGPRHAFLSDKNQALIYTYQAVKDDLLSLLSGLETLEPPRAPEDYYERRKQFNQLLLQRAKPTRAARAELASLFIWLNHTCFNGLYRVNRRGEFNVPVGSYANPTIYSAENLKGASRALKLSEARIECTDYESSLAHAKAGDFAYLDPPYEPVSATAKFTSYTREGFDFEEQTRLSTVIHNAVNRGVHIVLSNSSSPTIRSLYTDLRTELVKAPRAINCVGSKRGAVEELVVVA